MSHYQARQRAIRAERAAQRCVELCEEMRIQCARRERLSRIEAQQEFDLKHEAMTRQMAHMTELLGRAAKLASPIFVVSAS